MLFRNVYARFNLLLIAAVLTCEGLQPSSTAQEDVNFKSLMIEGWSGYRGMKLEGHQRLCERGTSDQGQVNCTSSATFKERFRVPRGISVNDDFVPGEGITLSVIHQRDGHLMLHKVFPLEYYWAYWADLQWYLKRIAPGRIVALTVSVLGCSGLRQTVRQLTEMGSLFAQHMPPEAHWTWVFIKGGRTISETAVIDGPTDTYVHSIVSFNLNPRPSQSTNNKLERNRWDYCERAAGMGGFCDEASPDPLSIQPPPAVSDAAAKVLDDVKIIITAGKRHQYLYYSLTKLLAAPGARTDNLLVVLGDAPNTTTDLLQLLDINFAILPTQGQGNQMLFRYYRDVFQLISQRFHNSTSVIILDEDIEVSPDFFSFMSQILWLLQEDKSVYCVSGFGRPQELSHDDKKLYRGEAQVSWGYAITLDFVREALELWLTVPPDKGGHYDYWLYDHVAKRRECVFPEVSRTRHYGMGVNTMDFIHEKFFLSTTLVPEAGVKLNQVERLLLPLWKRDLTASIQGAQVLTGNPCSQTFVPRPTNPKTYVFYVSMKKKNDGTPNISDYYLVAHCLGAWGLSPQWLHDGVATFTPSLNATLHVIGVPYSSYAHPRPPNVTIWTTEGITSWENDIVRAGINARNRKEWANLNITSQTLMERLSIPEG